MFRNIVRVIRDSIKMQRLSGLLANDSFVENLEISKIAAASDAKLLHKHNDPQDPYHLSISEHLVIGADIQPAGMLVTLKISNPWSLLHALRAVIAGWTFKINIDVTFRVCSYAVDLLYTGINSITSQLPGLLFHHPIQI